MDKEFINALIYGFLGALGFTLLNTQPSTVALSPTWVGMILLVWGIATLLFTLLEEESAGAEHQLEITTILFLIMIGYVMLRNGIDMPKIMSTILLSIAIGRALGLLFNSIQYNLNHI